MSELDESQNAIESEMSGLQQEVTVSPTADDRPSTAEDTPKLLENQEKPAHAADALLTRLRHRQQVVDELLREKERLQLGYVTSKTPKSFYLRWKAECNQIFFLNVGLKRRLKRVAGKS